MPGLTGLAQTAVAALFAGAGESVVESKWHQPLSEPPRGKIAPQLAVALIASGLVYVAAAPFAEAVTEDRWHQPWSEPVRTRALAAPQRQALAPDPLPRVSFGWWVWLAEPVVKARPRLLEALQQHLAFAPPFNAGAVQSDWSGPPPSLVRLQYQAQARPPWPDINLGWLPPLAEPLRARPPVIIPAPEQQFQPFDEDIIFVDRWFAWWSEPVRVKPALGAASQQVLALDPQPFPFLGGGGGWYLPDPNGAPARRIKKPGAPRPVEPEVAPPSFADVLGSQQPAQLADLLGAAFAPLLAELRPPVLDLWTPPFSAPGSSPGQAVPALARQARTRPAVIDDIQDRLDAMAALRLLDEAEQERKTHIIAMLVKALGA
jgi:hypothetical protein